MEKTVTGAPRNKFYTGMTYRPGKFTLSSGVQVIDKLYLVTGDAPKTSNFTLIDTRVAYRTLKWMDVFVRFDNLLGKKYETMNGYPMPRTTVMVGISLVCPAHH